MGEVRKYNNMKTNILFTLLTLFLIIAITVGLYLKWNPTVIVVLLGIAFICSVCKLFDNCKELIFLLSQIAKLRYLNSIKNVSVDWLSIWDVKLTGGN